MTANNNRPKSGHSGHPLFEKGNPGGPGRPKGTRNKLGEVFIQALHADFMEHGDAVVRKVRTDRPAEYLKVVASLLPKELHVKTETIEEMTEDELSDILSAIRAGSVGESVKH